MAITVELENCLHAKENNICPFIGVNNHGDIVLFFEENRGVVLYSKSQPITQIETVSMDRFEKYIGKITLGNI